MALAGGALTNGDMAKVTGIEDRALFYYLNTLVELGYIIKHYPLTGEKSNPKQVRYKLHDPLLRFWFRFIYPNMSAIYQMEEKAAFLNLIKPHLDAYFGKCFETLCREALSRLYQKEAVTCAYELGEYWDKSTQIDLVGIRQDGIIDICECKWGNIASIPKLMNALDDKKSKYPNKANRTIHGRLFVHSKIKAPSADRVKVHSLSEIYQLE